MHAAIAVLDPSGKIRQVNAGWERLTEENGLSELGARGVGDDYFEAWRKAASQGCTDSARFLSDLMTLQEGGKTYVDFEFSPPSPPSATCGPRRYLLRAVPLPKPPGGVVVAHLEIDPSRTPLGETAG
jgi:hypothetical protein